MSRKRLETIANYYSLCEAVQSAILVTVWLLVWCDTVGGRLMSIVMISVMILLATTKFIHCDNYIRHYND